MVDQTKMKPTRTTMYSLDEQGRVVTHKLPWPKDSPKIEPLKARGFSFERPTDTVECPLVSPKDAPGVLLMPPLEQLVSEGKAFEAKEVPEKKWANMNATERKAYKESKGASA